MWNLKSKTNEQTQNKNRVIETKQTGGCQGAGGKEMCKGD